jgi:hypothetical protein
MAAIAE